MPVIDRMHLLGQMNALPNPRPSYRSQIDFHRHMNVHSQGLEAAEDALLDQTVRSIQQLTAPAAQSAASPAMGSVSAQFESGAAGVGAIGYDPNGGTSYGTYQIASRPGTMERFLQYLEKVEPSWAARLRAAGPANTGSTTGGMPTVWKAIASENPQRFESIQHRFVEETHFEPARQAIAERTGFDVAKAPAAVREALWSTAVQHGPAGAARIFTAALKKVEQKGQGKEGSILFAQEILREVYALRGEDFKSSPAVVQTAVRERMGREGQLLLAMLRPGNAA